MKIIKEINKLCQPAYLYLVLSVFSIVVMMIQNAGNSNKYCVGNFECNVPSTVMIFIFKFLYVIFWTFILHVLCQAGYKNVSWFIVLIPFIMMAILIAMLFISSVFKYVTM